MKKKDNTLENTLLTIKTLLAEHIGVEPEDINDEDVLQEELHMTAADLTDFHDVLQKEGFNTESVDFNSVETVHQLAEVLSAEQEP